MITVKIRTERPQQLHNIEKVLKQRGVPEKAIERVTQPEPQNAMRIRCSSREKTNRVMRWIRDRYESASVKVEREFAVF